MRVRAIWRSGAAILIAVDGTSMRILAGGARRIPVPIVRLLHAGVRRKDGVFATGVIHLWHAEADRSQLNDNERKLDVVADGKRVRAQRGLSALAPAPSRERGGLNDAVRNRKTLRSPDQSG